jgi:hypothetical protein
MCTRSRHDSDSPDPPAHNQPITISVTRLTADFTKQKDNLEIN